jgi:uric acid-xanthine permease
MEAIGDITASAEVSRVEVEGEEFDSRIQGGVFGDGVGKYPNVSYPISVLTSLVGGLISGLMTNPPLSVFAQNNGVVRSHLTIKVLLANIPFIDCHHSVRKQEGRTVVLRLVKNRPQSSGALANMSPSASSSMVFSARFLGCSYPVSGIPRHPFHLMDLLPVPNPVLGGVTTFLFATVMTSGIRVLSYITWSRRNRFTLASAMAFGVGNLLAPGWYTHLFDGVKNRSPGLQGLFDSITIILSTPCKLSPPPTIATELTPLSQSSLQASSQFF